MDTISLLCCLLAFLLYYNTLDAGFVYDDRRAILNNPDLLPTSSWLNLLKNDFWGTPLTDSGSHGSYRPLCVFTFRINYLLGGFQPWGYHLVNVLLHVLATGLMVRVARVILPASCGKIGPAVAGLLFASHPIHTEAVAGIVGRADLAACNFYLLAFLVYVAHIRYRDNIQVNYCNGHFEKKQKKFNTCRLKYRDLFMNLRSQCYSSKNEFCCMRHNLVLSVLSFVESGGGGSCPSRTITGECSRGPCGCVSVSPVRSCGTGEGLDKCAVKQWLSLVCCIVLAVAAVFSKETGISVLVVCGLYDVVRSPLKISNKKQLRSIGLLGIALVTLLSVRIQMASGNTPFFSTADNPTAKSSSILTRFFTFLYLPTFNFKLLLFPTTLSFDWSMDAIPQITSMCDSRNFISVMFYFVLYKTVKHCVKKLKLFHYIFKKEYSKHNDAVSSSRVCRKRHNDIPASSISGSEQRMVTMSCPCPVCHHTFSDHHSQSCRTTNNNNTVPASHSMCICHKGVTSRSLAEELTATPTIITKDKARSLNAASVLLAITFLALPFLPATNMFFYVGFVVAERVLYLPSVGYCLLLGLGAGRLWHVRRCWKPVSVAFVLLLAAFSAKTFRRNFDWRDEESLYRSAIYVNPPKAYGNLGSVLNSQGRIAEAEWAYNKALEHRANMADVHYNLGILLQGREQYDEAIQSYKRSIHFRPSLALAYVNLGGALAAAGRCQEAAAVLRQGSRLDGTGVKDRRAHDSARVSALLQLGALYADQGRLRRALAAYREALHIMPDHYPPQSIYNLLGETLTRLQQFDEAERWYQAALQAQPDHVPAHITYGKLLAKNSSRVAEAEQWFKRAQRLAPADPSVHHHFGEFLASLQRFAEAAEHYVRAAELKPKDYELASAAATALRQADRRHDAECWYKRAVQLRPQDPRGHTNLGAILHLNGKYSQAATSYREALRLQPDDVTTLTNLHKLYSLMS